MNIKDILKYTLLLFLLLGVIVISTEVIISNIKDINHQKEAQNLHKQLKTLIDEKQSTTRIIGVSLAQNESIQNAIITNEPDLINLKNISRKYRAGTDFKNVWLHIVTKDGVSFSRSWVKKRGDSLLDVRMDIPIMLKNPEIKSHISTGIFDLTFKAMVPIYKENKFLGIFEVITHFNSISKKLAKNGIESVFLVDKSYKKQLKKPFTKMFVNNYYVANLDAPAQFRDFLSKDKNIEKLSTNKSKYFIDKKNDKFITVFHLKDIKDGDMAYMFMSKNLSSIKHDNVSSLRIAQISLVIIGFFIFILLVFYKKVKDNEQKLIRQNLLLEKQKQKTQKIFDAGPAITILTDGIHLKEANKEFFNFFYRYNSLSEFKKYHDCICDFFEYVGDESYIYDRQIKGESWIKYLVENSSKTHKVKMSKDGKEHHFVVIANISNTIGKDDNKLIVVSFVDITQEVKLQNDLRDKDKILLQQSKMVSMGEMIGNIAHQWRQPLSVISTVSTGLKMKLEHDLFDKEDGIKNLDTLNENAQYLSKTIDDFRNLFNKDVVKNSFDINTLIKKDIELLATALKDNNIELIHNTNKDSIVITSYENIFTQALLNIINNAKDALKEKRLDNKVIFLNTKLDKEFITLSIKDNAGGIKEEILERVFEPYFTTKHQSQGTGIGLYMTEQIITKHLHGEIKVKNVEFEYEGKIHKGAEFIVTLPVV